MKEEQRKQLEDAISLMSQASSLIKEVLNEDERKKKYNKEYQKNNPNCIKKNNKEYHEKNPEYFAKYAKEYYAKNKEALNNASKKYYEKNKEKILRKKRENWLRKQLP